jgi:hypothetical protein
MIIIIIQFIIYLLAELKRRGSVTESARIQTTAAAGRQQRTKQNRLNQRRLFTFKHEFLKISMDIQTASAVEAHLCEGRLVEERLNIEYEREYRLFQVQRGNI